MVSASPPMEGLRIVQIVQVEVLMNSKRRIVQRYSSGSSYELPIWVKYDS